MKTILLVLSILLAPFRVSVAFMEREKFGVRSFQGPRSAAGFGVGLFSDTGFTNSFGPVGQRVLGIEDWTTWVVDMEDFVNRYAAADWTVTKIGTGAGALAAGAGGLLAVTNSAASGDATTHTRTVGALQLATTKPFYFSTKFQVDNAANADVVVGLQKLNTTPWTDPTEEIVFKKAAAATVDFKFGNASVYSTSAAILTMVDATNVTLEFGYDGVYVYYSVNGVISAGLAAALLPVASVLTPVFAVRNNSAVARVLTLDYLFAAVSR